MKDFIILTGPTAVGKTSLSLALAKKIDGEIISADSMQVYKGMNIGTAKIKKEEMEGIPHHLIDVFEPDFPFNVTVFKEKVMEVAHEIKERGKVPILVGGTGFYIQAVLFDINFTETTGEEEVREQLSEFLNVNGKSALHKKLQEVDPEYAVEVSENNTKKVIRALSFYQTTGTKLSIHNKKEREKNSPFSFSYFVLTTDRKKLYERINARVDDMIQNGLVDEVRSLTEKGYGEGLVSMKGIGYKEVFPYLRGEITLDEMADSIKKNTRHFAKRQLTWFRREKCVTYVEKDKFSSEKECLAFLLEEIKK